MSAIYSQSHVFKLKKRNIYYFRCKYWLGLYL